MKFGEHLWQKSLITEIVIQKLFRFFILFCICIFFSHFGEEFFILYKENEENRKVEMCVR